MDTATRTRCTCMSDLLKQVVVCLLELCSICTDTMHHSVGRCRRREFQICRVWTMLTYEANNRTNCLHDHCCAAGCAIHSSGSSQHRIMAYLLVPYRNISCISSLPYSAIQPCQFPAIHTTGIKEQPLNARLFSCDCQRSLTPGLLDLETIDA
ncbi:hypothetical protein BC831DRAFT_143159 [Entophlyctis helioformis]|nr:hypothetical protein BC831DRAFT_143159 [Entophlyctis helioformis]